MSALANKHINHNIELSEAITDAQQAATPISVTARIDYILRFSKQAVLVVDDNTSNYTQLARQYLANLSQAPSNQKLNSNVAQDVNVAFVVASSKLNDIQMRCRLVEQLFANTLFDPEQSLAVSILRLAKQQNDVVTIVIEHAHALSLQLKYELCQLVDIANKTKIKINVVLFGQEHAAQEISQNKSIFDKKISIVEANSGQVIAIDNARFNSSTPLLSSKSVLRISLISMVSVAILLLSWFFLTEHENFSLIGLSSEKLMTKQVVASEPKLQKAEEVKTITSKATIDRPIASNDDIYLAILGEVGAEPLAEVKPAESADILQALAFSEQHIAAPETTKVKAIEPTLSEVTLKQSKKAEVEKQELVTEATATLPVVLNHKYFIEQSQGYVVQIAGFSDLTVLAEFIAEYKTIEYFSYEKSLNKQKFIVLTSQVFTNKAQAQVALSELPNAIQQRGAFLKSVSIIKREINTVKG